LQQIEDIGNKMKNSAIVLMLGGAAMTAVSAQT